MARNTRAKITDNVEAGSCSFDFNDGGEVFEVKLSSLPKNIQKQLAVSRLHNKLMDTYADPDSNPRDEVMRAVEMLRAGEWSERGEGAPQQSLLADAVVRALAEAGKQVDREKTISWLDTQSKEQRAAIRKRADVAKHLAAIEAERKAERAKKLAAAAQIAPATGGFEGLLEG